MDMLADPQSGADLRGRARRAWPLAARRLLEAPAGGRWRRVDGPMSAVVATLLDLGWSSTADNPLDWVSETGEFWQLGGFMGEEAEDPSRFLEAVEQAVWAETWKAAPAHVSGRGLEDGCDLVPA